MEIGMRLPSGEALSYESPRLKLVIFRVIIVHRMIDIFIATAKLTKKTGATNVSPVFLDFLW